MGYFIDHLKKNYSRYFSHSSKNIEEAGPLPNYLYETSTALSFKETKITNQYSGEPTQYSWQNSSKPNSTACKIFIHIEKRFITTMQGWFLMQMNECNTKKKRRTKDSWKPVTEMEKLLKKSAFFTTFN